MINDPYKVLGVSPETSKEEIKIAYRQLAKKYHPDLNPGDGEATRKMNEVNAAYDQIKNPSKTQPLPEYGYGQGYNGNDQAYKGTIFEDIEDFEAFFRGLADFDNRQSSANREYKSSNWNYSFSFLTPIIKIGRFLLGFYVLEMILKFLLGG